ncbi:hypothetical protein ACH4L5_35450 [Streptomyces sp. NPDC017405]|uniref:hypothetical protein n=1 Tax=unclassified Streptomyces TaxID=2593676 RepID=UPI0037A63BCB
MERTRRTLEAVAAGLRDGIRARAVTFGPRPRPASAAARQPHAEQPGARHTPGRNPTGGVA